MPHNRAAAWLNTSSTGYCGVTATGSGCSDVQPKGSLDISGARSEQAFVAACARACKACGRCNFLSVSFRNGDCSWFEDCDLARLHTGLDGFRSGYAPHRAGRAHQSEADVIREGAAASQAAAATAEAAALVADGAFWREPFVRRDLARYHSHCAKESALSEWTDLYTTPRRVLVIDARCKGDELLGNGVGKYAVASQALASSRKPLEQALTHSRIHALTHSRTHALTHSPPFSFFLPSAQPLGRLPALFPVGCGDGQSGLHPTHRLRRAWRCVPPLRPSR